MSRQTPYFPLGGGLDVVTPVVQIPPGKIISGDNFEPWINGGYRRMLGYERFDGRPAPSVAVFRRLTLTVNSGATAPAAGDTITGDTSAATGVVVAVGTEADAGTYAITKISGTFQAEDANTGDYTITDVSANEVASTVEVEASWNLAAQDSYRDDIDVVPGEGPVRGIWQNRAKVYAVRDNTGATAGLIHKATAAGWDDTDIEYVHTLRFDAGTGLFAEGLTVTGGTSGATGTIHRIIQFGGSTGNSDAYGYLALTSVSGTFSDNEAITDSGSGSATANGASEQFALSDGGRYDFRTINFLASPTTYRVYGANGIDPAFEIDEDDIVTPILLDLSFDDSPDENNPYLVEEFDGALWLMFPGGSLQKSVTGLPLTFNGFLGAAEFGLSDEGTGLINSAGRVLIAFTRRQTHGFFPTGVSAYEKRLLSERSGGVLYTSEEIGSAYAIDDSGLVDLQRAERFGDFANSTVSDPIQPIVVSNIPNVIGSQAIRETNQYRALFSSGRGFIMRALPSGEKEFGTFDYGFSANPLTCCYTCEDEDTAPTYWMGGSDGYVYQCERGNNYDGEAIESFVRLPFVHNNSPSVQKRYRLAEIEIKAERNVTLVMAQDRDFENQESGTNRWNEDINTAWGGGGFYDVSSWDEVFWDANLFDYARFELYGTGRSVSLLLYHRDANTPPFILQGVILHFDPRRTNR